LTLLSDCPAVERVEAINYLEDLEETIKKQSEAMVVKIQQATIRAKQFIEPLVAIEQDVSI